MSQDPLAGIGVVFRCDASSQIGFGHVSRCLTLARGFRRRGVRDIRFLIRDLDKGVIGRIRAEGHACHVLQDDIDEDADISTVLGACEGGRRVLVTDSHDFSALYYEALHASSIPTVSFDDYAGVAYASDLVVNNNISAERFAYSLAPHTQLLLGTKYFPLREPFDGMIGKSRPVRDKVESLVIALGGMPEPEAAARILDGVRQWALAGDIRVSVVLGVQAGAEVTAFLEPRLPPRGELLVDPEDFALLLWNADMAIVNGSLIAYEAASIGTPLLITALSENQIAAVAGFNENGIALTLPPAEYLNPEAVTDAVMTLSANQKLRKRLAEAGRILVDGAGTTRIVERSALLFAERSADVGKGE